MLLVATQPMVQLEGNSHLPSNSDSLVQIDIVWILFELNVTRHDFWDVKWVGVKCQTRVLGTVKRETVFHYIWTRTCISQSDIRLTEVACMPCTLGVLSRHA